MTGPRSGCNRSFWPSRVTGRYRRWLSPRSSFKGTIAGG